MPARIVRLVAGCVLLGLGVSLMVLADLGLSPWDVLHQGLAEHTGIGIGTITILVGVVVLAGWIPLRQRPGAGTVINVILVGATVDGVLAHTSEPHGLAARWALLTAGVVVIAVGTALYVGAGLGTGPRDGLMMGLSRKHDRSVGGVRTGIELTALAVGALLGGTIGIGTLVFAVAIGPLVHVFLGRLTLPVPTLTPPSE